MKTWDFNKILLLGSASPRREELIRRMDIPYQKVSIDFDEKQFPFNNVEELALLKSKSFDRILQPDEILLTADTMVKSEGMILGKPEDEKTAYEMLKRISGKTHLVETGVCMRSADSFKTFSDITEVVFKPLNEEEIAYYIEKYRPYDKAGAYGIQEWIGLIGVEQIKGSFYTVMGLPTHLVWENWLKFNEKA